MKQISFNDRLTRRQKMSLKGRIGLAMMLSVLGHQFGFVAAGQEPIRQAIPQEHPGPPFYARALYVPEQTIVPIVFYRPAEKIPVDFNLLNFFDIPRALEIGPLQVSGFHLVKDAIPPAAPPMLQYLAGNAVPFWFVERTVLDAIISDGVVTIGELRSIVIHEGVATIFREMIQPIPGPDGAGGVLNSKTTIFAKGTLENGRSFALHYLSVFASGTEQLKLTIK